MPKTNKPLGSATLLMAGFQGMFIALSLAFQALVLVIHLTNPLCFVQIDTSYS